MKTFLIIAGIIASLTVILGIYCFIMKKKVSKSGLKKSLGLSVSSFVITLLGAITILIPDMVMAAETAAQEASSVSGIGYCSGSKYWTSYNWCRLRSRSGWFFCFRSSFRRS